MLPNVANLKGVFEKLRTNFTHLTVSANIQGEMTFLVESGHLKTEIMYEKLVNPELGSFIIPCFLC